MKTLFLVLEALDGVGKTTLARDLSHRLGAVAMNTPGDRLRGLAAGVLADLGDHQEARCLFYASSVLARGREALAIVEAGRTVVMDRYWLSTVSYARARGVEVDLRNVEALVAAPSVTVLLTLKEEERQRRITGRGFSAADRETLVPSFRERVLAELQGDDRRAELRPTCVVDVTGASRGDAVERVLAELRLLGWGIGEA